MNSGKTPGSEARTLIATTGEEIILPFPVPQDTNGTAPKANGVTEDMPKEKIDEGSVASLSQQTETAKVKSSVIHIKEYLGSRDGKTIGIARGEMRRLFLEGCENYIIWAKNVTGYETTANGVVALFSDGTKSIEGEMLIGGEGIHSKIAKQVSGGKLKVYDTGSRAIQGQAPTTAFKELGEGVWRIVDESDPNGRVFAMANVRPNELNDPTATFGWTMGGTGIIDVPGNDFSITGKPAADVARKLTRNWAPKIRATIDAMIEEDTIFWKITCSTPSGVPTWENEKRVTVIGDAVHSMTPAGGNGANTAVRDSELLGRLIVEAGGYADGVTAEYEKQMRAYGSEAVRVCYAHSAAFGIVIDEETTPFI